MNRLLLIAFAVLLQPAPEEDPFAPVDRPATARPAEAAPPAVAPDAEPIAAQEAPPDPASPPILRLSPNGPQARSAAVAFSPDGKTLYSAGADKVVHVWRLGKTPDDAYHDRPEHFVPAPERTLRVPVGPGLWGTINAMAVSPDGRWLAAGGWGWAEGRAVAGFRDTGLIWPDSAFFPETLEDIGTVFLFDLTTGRAKRLRGHQGPVIGLAFADGPEPAVVSIALEQPPGAAVKGVARAWDATTGREIGKTSLPKEPGERFAPSLVAWTLPDGTLRAVFTWSDGWVRVWDVGNKPRGFNVGLSMACVRRPGTDEVLFGEFAAGDNRLARRLLLPDPKNWRPLGNSIRFGGQTAPVDATFLASRPGTPADHLAVAVAEASPTGPKYHLDLLRAADGRRAGARVPLPFAATPALAASSAGYLAAASEADGTLLVFDTAKLLAGDTRPAERLDGAGLPVAKASWVRNDDRRGVRISDAAGGDRILDLTRGDVTTPAGWQAAAADPGRWNVRIEATPTKSTLRTTGPGTTSVATVPGRCDASAVCPAVPGLDRPVLAAAATGADDAGWLYLFDARSGQRLRKLTGHTGPVASLAFSSDGRLLVSAAADRTVNIWWLGDLTDLVGRQGLLRGVNLVPADGGLEVKELTDETPGDLRRVLPVGRVVRGIVREEDRLETFASPGAFYKFVSGLVPDSVLTLRTDAGDVAVRVGQAIDERKPLFSLFVERDAATGGWSWIGWSPLGPFESSDRLVERLVGWHFNPRRPEEPVRFADLGEYRESFFGRGLLDALIRTGRVPDQWPPVAPKVSVLLRDAAGEPSLPDAGRVDADAAPAELIVEVTGVPADRVVNVTWRLDDGEPLPLRPSPGLRGAWIADLAGQPLAPGEHRFSVDVEGRGFDPLASEITLGLRPQAAAAPRPPQLPRVVIRSPSPDEAFYEVADPPGPPRVTVEALVAPWRGDAPLDAEFLIDGQPARANGEPIRVSIAPSEEPQSITAGIPLAPGRNRLSVRLLGPAGAIGPEQSVVVRHLRPPVVLSLDAPQEVDGDSVAFRADVRSPIPLLPETVRVTVGGVPVATPSVQIDPADVEGRWTVAVAGVPLGRKDNRITFAVANADGPSRSPADLNVTRVSAAPKPVFVEFDEFPRQFAVSSRTLPVTMTVRSSARLTRAELYVNGSPTPVPLPVPEVPGEYVFERVAALDRTVNALRFVATAADGGVGQAETTVTVVERPVTIEIDRLVATDGTELLPRAAADGTLGVNVPVPTDVATVHGRIIWSSPADVPAAGHVYLHAWVNGFLQASRRLDADGRALEQRFELPVALNRRNGNSIRLELPALAEDKAERRQLVLDCADPNARQRVHLLLAGVGLPAEEGDRFARDVVQSLHAGEPETNDDDVIIYRPLVGDVYAGDIMAHLQLFRFRPPEPDAAHDVLLLYFHGEEASKSHGHFALVTSDSGPDPASDASAVTSRRLSDLLEETRGAHLLFLDVARYDGGSEQPPASWPHDTHLGVLRSVWLGDGPMPAELSLTKDLSQASRDDRRFGRIAASIERFREGRDELLFDPHVPPDLADLVLLGSSDGL